MKLIKHVLGLCSYCQVGMCTLCKKCPCCKPK